MSKALGAELRKIRQESGETLVNVASSVGIDRSHLTKVELGQDKPSETLLNSLIAHFSLERVKASRLWGLAGFSSRLIIIEKKGRKELSMNEKIVSKKQPVANVNVSIDPSARPVLYSESVFIQSSDFGLTMDFAQQIGSSDQQFVVARIGMSFDHAKKMLEVLSDHLQKNER